MKNNFFYTKFDLVEKLNKKKIIKNFVIPLIGKHNVQNCLASISLSKYLNISYSQIKKSLKTFQGVKRRFSVLLNNGKNLIIDVPNKLNLDFNFFGAGNDLLMHLFTAVDYPYVVYTERTFAGLKGHEGSFTTTNDLAKYYFIAKQFFCKKHNFIILYFMLNVYKLIFGLPKTKNL